MSTNTQDRSQLILQPLPDHFELDTHLEVRGAAVESVHVLSGETEREDVIVVRYRDSPALSFYDVYGRLIDVDHYLPDNYAEYDRAGVDSLLANLRAEDANRLEEVDSYEQLLAETLAAGDMQLREGLRKKFGLETDQRTETDFLVRHGLKGRSQELPAHLLAHYTNFRHFLTDYLELQFQTANTYAHITANASIIITPLNKRSGVAVVIETRDADGRPLRPGNWRITRTTTPTQLEQALVFRTQDIQDYFAASVPQPVYRTDRYEMREYAGRLVFDSLLDDTSNLLTVELRHHCFQPLASDPDVLIALSDERAVTIVNTHRSVVPKKWTDVLPLPADTSWVRTDENLAVLFCLEPDRSLAAYDATTTPLREVGRLSGPFLPGFAIDQMGGLLLVGAEDNNLLRVQTNVNELLLPGQEATFGTVFKDLSAFFRGEQLFTQVTYAKRVTEVETETEEALPTAIAEARFDFETNVDHLLAAAGEDYDQLLEVREKIAIARRNIEEKLTTFAEEQGLRLVGQRLQQTIGNIVRPAERRVTGLVERIRAQQLLEQARGFRGSLGELTDPGAYRDVLNSIRAASEELLRMDPANAGTLLTEFREIQTELNAAFSRQIAEDGNALKQFINREIEQIEEAIEHTHDPRQLERLLATHPAALELMNLLKQPFVLQSVAAERSLSPAGIQHRLYAAVEERSRLLRREAEQLEADRNAAKLQLAGMIRQSIDFFVTHHSGGFSDLELSDTAAYQSIVRDTDKLERIYQDTRLANELRQKLERAILDRNRKDLERAVAFEGKYAFIQNDPDLYVDLESTVRSFPTWELQLIEKASGDGDRYQATFVRDSDREVFRPSTTENLRSGRAFDVDGEQVADYLHHYERYIAADYEADFLDALWAINRSEAKVVDFPQFAPDTLENLLPPDEPARRALGAAREKRRRDRLERTRTRNVPRISPEFIDETPYFQEKLREFVIKAKLQLGTGSGVLLLSGPPSTGKSAFLKFVAALMNREYFEHASDKWQTKNSLVTAIRFGENGPYTTPAGFTRAITTGHSLLNIEEIKEWPEALRKSLNPFFAGSDVFTAPDGTTYRIGDNLLLCAAANLGSMYRQEDEPFTADFWSRIEVVEYDYAPHTITTEYYEQLHKPVKHSFLTLQDLVRYQFDLSGTTGQPEQRARTLAQRLLEFLLLPKADEKVKRDRLQQQIATFFEDGKPRGGTFGPEEAAKVSLRRLRDFQQFSAAQFFDLYDHFINTRPLRNPTFARLQSQDTPRYEHYRILFLTIWYLEGCLRHVREVFYSTAGQTEIEGTNREFISAVYLLGLFGRLE